VRSERTGGSLAAPVRGQMMWTTFAQYAGLCTVLARTDLEARTHVGISAGCRRDARA